MKQFFAIASTCIAAALIWGCGDATKEAPPLQSPNVPSVEEQHGSQLGSESTDGQFAVVLSADKPDLKVGKATFTATVTFKGEPAEDAKVSLNLSMPTMNMNGPALVLKHSGGGRFSGETDLTMGGDWLAKVDVAKEGQRYEAIYRFVALQ